MDMDHMIFRKLQDVVERPCRSKEWFGVAEQAINTVYVLGERPDILCDRLIKNLTVRAFSSKPKQAPAESEEADPDRMDQDGDEESAPAPAPQTQDGGEDDDPDKDVGEAFELSQLLFIVGHVAIKHIVYLELVERELKRQKHEKEQGKPVFLLSPERDADPCALS